MIAIFRYWLNHPLAKQRIIWVCFRFVWWQLICRIQRTTVVSFATKSRLIVTKGMTGATGNIYCGLHEFEDMGFLLHALRSTDHFLDIGANIGSYSILAASEVGATVDSFEPVPSTFHTLEQNIQLNQLGGICQSHNQGLGSSNQTLRFTSNRDTTNHVIPSESRLQGIDVQVTKLDNHVLPDKKIFAKVDVEGFEKDVIRGGHETLRDPNFTALIIELNGSGKRYGHDDLEIHQRLIELDFLSHTYDPLNRALIPLHKPGPHNTIYIKREYCSMIEKRVVRAEKKTILGTAF